MFARVLAAGVILAVMAPQACATDCALSACKCECIPDNAAAPTSYTATTYIEGACPLPAGTERCTLDENSSVKVICYKCGSGANSLQCVIDTDDQDTYDKVKAKISGTGEGSICSEPQGQKFFRTCADQQCGDGDALLIAPFGTCAPTVNIGTNTCPIGSGPQGQRQGQSNVAIYNVNLKPACPSCDAMSSCGGAGDPSSSTFTCATSDSCVVPATDDDFCGTGSQAKVDQGGDTLACDFCTAGNCA